MDGGVEGQAQRVAIERRNDARASVGMSGDHGFFFLVDHRQIRARFGFQRPAHPLHRRFDDVAVPQCFVRIRCPVFAHRVPWTAEPRLEERRRVPGVAASVAIGPDAERPEHTHLTQAIAERGGGCHAEHVAQNGGVEEGETCAGFDHRGRIGAQAGLVGLDVRVSRWMQTTGIEQLFGGDAAGVARDLAQASVKVREQLEQVAPHPHVGTERAGIDEGHAAGSS